MRVGEENMQIRKELINNNNQTNIREYNLQINTNKENNACVQKKKQEKKTGKKKTLPASRKKIVRRTVLIITLQCYNQRSHMNRKNVNRRKQVNR